jgi:hypothetical protein
MKSVGRDAAAMKEYSLESLSSAQRWDFVQSEAVTEKIPEIRGRG